MHATRHEQVNTWITTVSSQMPHLSKPQATVLALWSFAAVIAQLASMTLSALLLAGILAQKANTLRQRLKEFYKPQAAKKGDQRQELDVEACFAPLLSWVLRLWPGQQIALALDPTLCRDRFVCLSVSLVYDGGSILVALLNQVGLPMPEALHPAPWPVTVGCRRIQLVKEHPAEKNLPL